MKSGGPAPPDIEEVMEEAMVEIQQEGKQIVNPNLEVEIVGKVTIPEMVKGSILEDSCIIREHPIPED